MGVGYVQEPQHLQAGLIETTKLLLLVYFGY